MFPRTFQERLNIGLPVLRVPATWEEYLELADTADYRVQYREGHIISFLEIEETTNGTAIGEASIPHETLVMRFATQLSLLLDAPESDVLVLCSNLKVFLPEARRGATPMSRSSKANPSCRNMSGKNARARA